MKRDRFAGWIMTLSLCGLCVVMGCHRRPVTPVVTTAPVAPHPHRPAPEPLTADQLKQARPNEAGVVPILVYFTIKPASGGKPGGIPNRTPEQFRKDLERLYKENFRPIRMSEFLDNKIDIAYGMKPVILTFDDSLPSQFEYRSDGSIDPNCAVGILQAFSQAHPDFPVKATFYVLPDRAFGTPDEAGKKLQALLDMGCELGNHTLNRPSLGRLSDERVKYELAGAAARIKELAPKAQVDTVAPPMSKSAHNTALMKDGVYQGRRYHNRAVLRLGDRPASVPYARSFNPLRVPRILTVEGPAGITYWLDDMQRRHTAFVSDGEATITTVPKNLEAKIDRSRLHGAALRTY